MPVKRFSDQQIISAIENSASMNEASLNLGMNLSGLNKRRRRIEKREKIEIRAPQATKQFEHLQIAHIHPTKKDLGILNGTVIVFSDAHFWPGVYTTAFKGLLWAIKELKPKAVIAIAVVVWYLLTAGWALTHSYTFWLCPASRV